MIVTYVDVDKTMRLRDMAPGDFFRFANGQDTDGAFVALSKGTEQYCSYIMCRDLKRDKLKKLWITNKERRVVFLNVVEIKVADSSVGADLEVEEEDKPTPADAGAQA